MSKKKAGGSSKNGRDSNSRRLGFKKYSNELIFPGNIILRQKSTIFYPGKNVGMGKDYTLFSFIKGKIIIKNKNKKKYIEVI
ncbi:50S ribosomal protein L27p [Candidatus Nasuia deltocephalinicola]|nr:50S ribosomal protein L27p [Candidatus Nasuia deltocephalinicola]